MHHHSTAAQPKAFEMKRVMVLKRVDGVGRSRRIPALRFCPLCPTNSSTRQHTIPHPFGVGQPNTQDQGWPLLLHQSWASVDHPRQKIGLMFNDGQRYNMLKAVGDLCFSLIHHFQAEPPPVMMIIKKDIRNMIMTQEV